MLKASKSQVCVYFVRLNLNASWDFVPGYDMCVNKATVLPPLEISSLASPPHVRRKRSRVRSD
jgi:hypothetical protein